VARRYRGPFDVFFKIAPPGVDPYVDRLREYDPAAKAAQEIADTTGYPTFVMDLWTMHVMKDFRPKVGYRKRWRPN